MILLRTLKTIPILLTAGTKKCFTHFKFQSRCNKRHIIMQAQVHFTRKPKSNGLVLASHLVKI